MNPVIFLLRQVNIVFDSGTQGLGLTKTLQQISNETIRGSAAISKDFV